MFKLNLNNNNSLSSKNLTVIQIKFRLNTVYLVLLILTLRLCFDNCWNQCFKNNLLSIIEILVQIKICDTSFLYGGKKKGRLQIFKEIINH